MAATKGQHAADAEQAVADIGCEVAAAADRLQDGLKMRLVAQRLHAFFADSLAVEDLTRHLVERRADVLHAIRQAIDDGLEQAQEHVHRLVHGAVARRRLAGHIVVEGAQRLGADRDEQARPDD